jgi:hypothetical protein
MGAMLSTTALNCGCIAPMGRSYESCSASAWCAMWSPMKLATK